MDSNWTNMHISNPSFHLAPVLLGWLLHADHMASVPCVHTLACMCGSMQGYRRLFTECCLPQRLLGVSIAPSFLPLCWHGSLHFHEVTSQGMFLLPLQPLLLCATKPGPKTHDTFSEIKMPTQGKSSSVQALIIVAQKSLVVTRSCKKFDFPLAFHA